ncbi:hypothetical protein NHX12_032808 [Muraenolepis orangiensis]|uniref:Uncharacterized protein n=1 Tax=Muraenolepis orangiensis TaxID=630683 RepID=A0A9Q0E2J0_9TELE|nr:hypothetical protein NHX12_032808 [Muraenolepis orangiensis]
MFLLVGALMVTMFLLVGALMVTMFLLVGALMVTMFLLVGALMVTMFLLVGALMVTMFLLVGALMVTMFLLVGALMVTMFLLVGALMALMRAVGPCRISRSCCRAQGAKSPGSEGGAAPEEPLDVTVPGPSVPGRLHSNQTFSIENQRTVSRGTRGLSPEGPEDCLQDRGLSQRDHGCLRALDPGSHDAAAAAIGSVLPFCLLEARLSLTSRRLATGSAN